MKNLSLIFRRINFFLILYCFANSTIASFSRTPSLEFSRHIVAVATLKVEYV